MYMMTSPSVVEEEIASALNRAALKELTEEVESRRVPSLQDMKSMKALIAVTSNNQLFILIANLLHRSGLRVPDNVVWDNGTAIRIIGAADGYHVSMINPKKVSNPDRFITPEALNKIMADSGHQHLNLPVGTVAYIVRHGHAGHNDPMTPLHDARDADLTGLGRTQAQEAGQAIACDALQLGVVLIKAYCSDLVRTMQTADIIISQFPEHIRPKVCKVIIEAHESTRAIGGIHHWEEDDLLRAVAMDASLSIEDLRPLFKEGTEDAKIERSRVENWARNNPVDDWDQCIKRVGDIEIDWSDYIAKVVKARNEGKTFGDAAAETLFLDVILQEAREAVRE
jgi:broad specificity phosphatase PhoE